MTLVEASLFVLGLAMLVVGADRAVRGAAELALYMGVSTFFVGVTVVSIGTSVPEMTTSIVSSYYGAGELLVGNILGSEVAQITLALGLVALVHPIEAERHNVAVYGSAMMLSMVIMVLVIEDGFLIRSEGFLMAFAYLFFLYHLYTTEGGEEVGEEIEEDLEAELEEAQWDEEASPLGGSIAWVLVGLALVGVGGHLMVTNGVQLARAAGVSELLIGLLAGLGTTLPEIAVALRAAWAGDPGISIGGLLGSNITDPVFSLGVGGLVRDVSLGDPSGILLPAVYMIAVSAAVLVVLWLREGMGRVTGAACALLYLPSFFLL